MKHYVFVALASVLMLASCGGGSTPSSTSTTQTASAKAAEAEAKYDKYVCTTSPLAMRKSPERKDGTNYITGLNLGEVVSYTGEEVLDSLSKTTFAKVIASDGTEGWVIASFVVPLNNLCVTNSNTELFQRPQLVTKVKNNMLYLGDLFVKMDEKDGFTQVKTLKDQKTYWIVTPISYLTSENDVTLALNVASKKMLEKGEVSNMEKFIEFMAEVDTFSDTELYVLLNNKIPVVPEYATEDLSTTEADTSSQQGHVEEIIEE